MSTFFLCLFITILSALLLTGASLVTVKLAHWLDELFPVDD